MRIILAVFVSMLFCIPAFAGFQEQVTTPYNYKFSSSTAVTVVKTLPGILHALIVEGGSASPITITDGSGPQSVQIAVFPSTNAIQTYPFDVGFSSGCVVTTNGTLQYTVSYL